MKATESNSDSEFVPLNESKAPSEGEPILKDSPLVAEHTRRPELPWLPTDIDTRPKITPDRYEILQEIARGGVGVIYRARDKDLGRELAVKVLHERYRTDRSMMLGWVEEVQIVRQLRHPGIAQIHDMGYFADGTPFFAMNLVEGRTLSQILAERISPHDRPLQFLGCFLKVCQTVAHAHSRGVVHRDLRPANVMVGVFGEVQIMDWGMARVLAPSGEASKDTVDRAGDQSPLESTVQSSDRGAASLAGSVLSTPSYMAPEQARGSVDPPEERTDVFGLGAILCEIMTGEPPYRGGFAGAILQRARNGDLAPALAGVERSGFDRELVRLTKRCLSADAAERPRHAGIVATELSAILASAEERARAAKLAASTARARAFSKRRSKRWRVPLTVTVLLVILVGSGGMLWVRERSRSRSARATVRAILAIDEAERSRLEGRQAPVEDMTAWTKTVEAFRRAEEIAREEPVDEQVRTRIADLKSSIAAEFDRAQCAAEQARKGRQLVEALKKVREEHGNAGWLVGVPPYDQVLKEHELDAAVLSVEAASLAIQATGVSSSVAQALDDWAHAKRWVQPERSAEWKKLLEIARRVDPDSLRNKVRQALIDDDLNALGEISRSRDLSQAGADTRVLVDTSVLLLLAGRSKLAAFEAKLGSILDSLHQMPRNADAWAQAAKVFGALDDPLEAIEALRQAVNAKPCDPEVRGELAVALISSGFMAEAVRELEVATQLEPKRENYWFLLAGAREGLGEPEEALRAAEKAVGAQPKCLESHLLLGRLLKDSGRYEEAVPAILRAMRLGEGTPGWSSLQAEAWIREARVMIELDHRMKDFRRGECRPLDNRQRVQVALLFHQRHFHATATRYFAEAFEWDNSLIESHFLVSSRAAARAAAGQGADAQESADGERHRFLQLAQAWILAGVEAIDRANKQASGRRHFTRELRRILGDVSFAPLSNPASLGYLSASDCGEVSRFWKGLKDRAVRSSVESPSRAGK